MYPLAIQASSDFQAAKQVQLFTGGATDMGPGNPLYRLERSMGVVQHHDAVSGTAKQVRGDLVCRESALLP